MQQVASFIVFPSLFLDLVASHPRLLKILLSDKFSSLAIHIRSLFFEMIIENDHCTFLQLVDGDNVYIPNESARVPFFTNHIMLLRITRVSASRHCTTRKRHCEEERRSIIEIYCTRYARVTVLSFGKITWCHSLLKKEARS